MFDQAALPQIKIQYRTFLQNVMAFKAFMKSLMILRIQEIVLL